MHDEHVLSGEYRLTIDSISYTTVDSISVGYTISMV